MQIQGLRRTSDQGATFIFKPSDYVAAIKTNAQGRITAVKYISDFTGSGDITVDPVAQYIPGTNDLYEWGYYTESGIFSATLSNR
jgi:hypothetical protein